MTNKYTTREELEKLIEDAQMFNNWSKVENANVSKITDMSKLFYQAKGIKNLDLSRWDTSNVEDMQEMFYNSDFNSPLYFDTSKVKNMVGMFFHSNYNHPLEFNTSNVTNMSNMFAYSKYNYPLHFDTSKVLRMEEMFWGSKYNNPLHFDTSNVIDMDYMFESSSFNQDISDWVIQENKYNKDVIKYRDKCIIKRKERGVIEASIENNKNKKGFRI